MSPNSREVIGAISTITGKQEYLTSTNGALNVNASISISGSPIPATGLTTALAVQIVDGSGNQITSFGGGTQYTDGGTPPTHPIGPTLEFNNAGTWVTVGTSNPLPITGSISVGGTVDESTFTAGTSTFTSSGGVFNDSVTALSSGQQGTHRLTPNRADHVNLRNNAGTEIGTATTPLQVSLANTGANTNKLLVTADPITFASPQAVTLTSTTITGTVAVTQSGTWNITNISGTVSLPTGASTETTLAKLPLAQGSTTSGQSGPLVQGAVTTAAPTYSTTQTSPLSLDTSGNLRTAINGTVTVSGTVTANAGTNLNTSLLALESGGNLATLAGTVTSAVLQTNEKQINGVVPLMGNGTTGTGSQRVTIASDNTAFSVNATLSAETTKVIGTVNQGTSPWVVGQGTAANLNATVVGTGTFAVQNTAATPAGTNGIGNVGTVSAVVNVGQQTVSTTAVQLSASSTVPTNGIIVRALTGNAANIYVGGSGVTTSTGYELAPGESISFTCNLNTLYIRSVASTTDKVCYNVE